MQAPDPTPKPLDHLALRGEPNAPALKTRDGLLDYGGLDAAVGILAASLGARGLKRGARVASWLPKTRMTSLLPLACASAGLVHVPINPLLKRAPLQPPRAERGGEDAHRRLEAGIVEQSVACLQGRRIRFAAQSQMVQRLRSWIWGLHLGSWLRHRGVAGGAGVGLTRCGSM